MTARVGPIAALAALLACHSATPGPGGLPLPEPAASATLRDSTGARIGVATFTLVEGSARLGVSVAGLAPGQHGIHLHERGVCTPPDFSSAGGHLNPAGRKHGLENPEGPHAGDLPNLMVESDGSADTVFALPAGLLALGPGGVLRPEGTAVVIHAGRDDQRTDPSGNSGARLACGVIQPA